MNKFEQLGFSEMDAFLLVICVGGGIIDSLIDYILKRDTLISFPSNIRPDTHSKNWLPWFGARLIVGFFSGGVVWLLLAGGMTQNKENFCRLLLMSLAAGFSSPSIVTRYRGQIDETVALLIKKSG